MSTASTTHTPRAKQKLILILGCSIFLATVIGYEAYAQMMPFFRHNVHIGSIDVSGKSLTEAREVLLQRQSGAQIGDIALNVEKKSYPIPASDIDRAYAVESVLAQALQAGRSMNPFRRVAFLLRSVVAPTIIPLTTTFNEAKLHNAIEAIASTVDEPGKDVRLHAIDGSLVLLTDTKTGFVLDTDEAYAAVTAALRDNQPSTKVVSMRTVTPTVQIANAERTLKTISRALEEDILLTHEWKTFRIRPVQLAAWVISSSKGPELDARFDDQQISAYVTTIAQELNAEPQAPKVTVVNDKVTDFVAPRSGKTLDQTKTIAEIQRILMERQTSTDAVALATIELPVSVVRAETTDASAAELGITELIGTATTPFTGSPKNRISNIKNGAKFLTGILIKPGEEFSTLKTLGTVDNTTGYLPELVIKGDRTTPEYGGGLCQVSTTLFRAVMNTGLPVTARQNHSYRVTYYEKDGDGNLIGPGLDATIYQPAPDFKFINDTGSTILIQGYVVGDKLTFDFYGTRDGRVSEIDGPHTLSSTPAGEPIYTETDELAPGEERRIETAHPGGTAIATYTVTYPDGTKKEQVFKSFYRNWPARYLVGRDPNKPAEEPLPPTDGTEAASQPVTVEVIPNP